MLCGIDEAGRGPLAGPVCAAAVVLPDDFPMELLNDSKKLNPMRRETARRIIAERAFAWAVAWATHTEIDAINILQASLLAMKRAVEFLLGDIKEEFLTTEDTELHGVLIRKSFLPPCSPWLISSSSLLPFGRPFAAGAVPAGLTAVVDGLYVPAVPLPCTPMVKADASVHAVMAASILAKTARDQLMEYYGGLYPQYGYERHKGYPTREHRALVRQYGPSPIQRKSFRV
jgi:ribonuclease HII